MHVALVTVPKPCCRRTGQPVAEESSPPLGLLYLAAALEARGVETSVTDLFLDPDQLKDSPCLTASVVGISFDTPSAAEALCLSKQIHSLNPNTLLVAGGHHATSVPEDCLNNGAFHVALRGEAEETLPQLFQIATQGGKPSDFLVVPGAVVQSGDKALHSAAAFRPPDIDRLPRPLRSKIRIDSYSQKGALLASRGCAAGCIFCSASFRRAERRRAVADVIAEAEHIIRDYGVIDLSFLDDSFPIAEGWTIDLCERLSSLPKPVRWGCTCRVSDFRADILDLMARSGCRSLHFGAESGDADVLSGLRKGCSPEQIEHAVLQARRAGIEHICCSFIVGCPNETPATAAATIRFASKLRRFGATHTPFSILTPYPGSPIFEKPEKFGVRIESYDWSRYVPTVSNISTQFLTAREIEELYFDALTSLTS